MTYLINPFRFGPPPATPAAPSVDWSIRSLCGSQTAVNYSEAEMAASIGGANLCIGGTGRERWTTFNPNPTFSVSGQLFDGNTATARTGSTHDDMEAAYQFSTAQTLREIRLRSATISFADTPLGFIVNVSYDGRATWLPVAVFTTPNTWGASETRSFSFDPRVNLVGTGRSAARAWRVRINGWDSGLQPRIGDLIFAGVVGGPTLCTGGSAICNASGSGQNPQLAFDANVTTFWNGVGVSVLGQRLGYVFPNLVNVRQIRMQASASPGQTPRDFEVQWSANLTTWTTALTVTGSGSWSASEIRTWTIP